jgi:site-specific recombinase XerD
MSELALQKEVASNNFEIVTPNYIESNKREQLELLREFLLTKKIEGCSMATLRNYHLRIGKLITTSEKDVRDLNAKELRAWLYNYQETHNCSNRTLNNMRLILSSFYRFLEDEDYVLKSPMRKIHSIKYDEVIKIPFTDEELERIRKATDNPRDLLIVDLLYSTGMRIGELVTRDIKDVDFREREILVKGKGGKERICYFNAKSKLELLDYLDCREDRNPALIVKRRYPHERISIQSVEKMLKEVEKRSGVQDVHPHRFRRTLATNLLNKGMTLEQVQNILGHTKIETTLIYAQIDKSEIKRAHQKYTF